MLQVDSFNMATESSDIPGLVVTEEPITAEDIPNVENIGGKPNEVSIFSTC